MAYDENARLLGIKAICTVESNLKYDSIYYVDPITIGIMQWYGPEVPVLLHMFKNENPSSWVGIQQSLLDDLANHPGGWDHPQGTWWTTRYLTKAEGESLRPVLMANKAIQMRECRKYLDRYMNTAKSLGMDIENNTLAALFFCSMEHQGPKYARQVLSSAGSNASLERIHAICLNHSVLGKYRNRYNQVKAILLSGDTSGLDNTTPADDIEGGNDGVARATGNLSHCQLVGNEIFIYDTDGNVSIAYGTGGTYFKIDSNNAGGVDIPDTPPSDTEPEVPPSSADVAAKQTAIKNFLTSKQRAYRYSQGPGRLTPESSGYSDCSAVLHWSFKKILGISIGTWTGNQYTNGTHIASGSGSLPISRMQVGDLVFFDWRGNGFTAAYDHVEMYYGNNQLIGHGGPGSGPTIKANTGMANTALRWRVQRVIR